MIIKILLKPGMPLNKQKSRLQRDCTSDPNKEIITIIGQKCKISYF